MWHFRADEFTWFSASHSSTGVTSHRGWVQILVMTLLSTWFMSKTLKILIASLYIGVTWYLWGHGEGSWQPRLVYSQRELRWFQKWNKYSQVMRGNNVRVPWASLNANFGGKRDATVIIIITFWQFSVSTLIIKIGKKASKPVSAQPCKTHSIAASQEQVTSQMHTLYLLLWLVPSYF